MSAVVEVANLNYNSILQDISFSWKQSERIALMGANGSGKSTLAKVLAGRLQFSTGEIRTTQAGPLWQTIGLIGQHPRSQILGATVGEELAFGLVNQRCSPKEIDDQVRDALQSLGLQGKENESPSNLSGGERQRLVAAAIILTNCPFLILDESLSMLDLNAQSKIYEFISQAAKDKGQIWITHDPELAVKQERLLLIKDGKLYEGGSPRDLLSNEKLCLEFGIQSLHENRFNGTTYIDSREVFFKEEKSKEESLERSHENSQENSQEEVVSWKEAIFPPGINLNNKVFKNEFIAVVGPSGSGKTTLLESIIGIRKPISGKVEINKENSVGFLLQEAGEYLIGNTVYDEVFYLESLNQGFFSNVTGSKKRGYQKNISYLRDYNLENLANTSTDLLSGGQKQNVALASVMHKNPSLLLLDEPLLGLDIAKREETIARLEKLKQKGQTTIIYITHDLAEVLNLATRIWLMEDGNIILDCSVSQWENYREMWQRSGVKIPGNSTFYEETPIKNRFSIKDRRAMKSIDKYICIFQRLDPRLKMLSLMFLALIISLSNSIALSISSVIIISFYLNKPSRLIISWKSMGCILGILAGFYALLLGWEGYTGLKIWEGHLNLEGLIEAAFITWKITLIFSLTLLLISTTSYVEQGLTINWILKPILKLKNSGNLSLLIMLTLRFIPLLKEEILHLWKARIVKGPLSTSLPMKIKEIYLLILPLLKLTLKRAEEVSESLFGRGYNPKTYQSYSHFKWHKRDTYGLIFISTWVVALGIIIIIY